jgi:hypothetical protein
MCFLVAQSVWAAPAGYIDASLYGGGYNATDATAALQAAINTGQNVYVPQESSDWFLSSPITLANNNQEVQFQSGVTVTAKSGYFTGAGDCLFDVTGSGVSMVGPGATLQMQQADYTKAPYAPSESRHAINLMGVTNCTIDGLNIRNTGGDGVIVNAGASTSYSQNVTIENCTINNAYRNGISVISVNGLLVNNCTIVNTTGTDPKDGMDFEPDNSSEMLQNVVVRNSIIASNARSGIEFILGSLIGKTATTYAMPNSSLDHLTIFNNGDIDPEQTSAGIVLDKYIPGLTIKNSLVGNNRVVGIVGFPDGHDLTGDYSWVGPLSPAVTNTVFWGNADGPAYFVQLDDTDKFAPYGQTDPVTPTFSSMDINSPNYMCLDPSCDPQVIHGADDGSYLGARGVVPEPTTAGLLLCGVASFLGFVALRKKNKEVNRAGSRP